MQDIKKKQAIGDVVYVMLDAGHLQVDHGYLLPVDLCASVKENIASAAKKIDKVTWAHC